MDKIISILAPFFEQPFTSFHIREIAKKTKINHTTIRQHLLKLAKEEYLLHNKNTYPYDTYIANHTSSKFHNLKLFFNLEKIRKSNLLEKINKAYDKPLIILFGSYAKAQDDEKSDIDLAILTPITKEMTFLDCEKIINRKISLHLYTPQLWETTKKKNPYLINNMCNGIILSGQLEVL